MSLLDAVQVASTPVEKATDSLGGVFLVDSGVYNFMIDVAYLSQSVGGATAINLHLKDGNTLLRQTVYITSGTAKGSKTTYTDKKTGEERPLPGWSQINNFCTTILGKGLKELSQPEDKIIKLYNFDAKKEVDTKVEMLMDLVNQPVTLGILKIIENKNVKNDSGQYVPSGDTREINEIAKVFRAKDGLSLAEIEAGATEAVFKKQWADKNTGRVVNKATAPLGTPAAATSAPAPTAAKPLFTD